MSDCNQRSARADASIREGATELPGGLAPKQRDGQQVGGVDQLVNNASVRVDCRAVARGAVLESAETDA